MKINDEKQEGIDSLVLKEEKGLRLKNLAKALPVAVLSTCIAYGVYGFLDHQFDNYNLEQFSSSQIVEKYPIQEDRF